MIKHSKIEVKVEKIFAGKLRRYHKASLGSRLIDIKTNARNFFDLFTIALGFAQSLVKLVLWRPRVVFCKGGFVCLPVGLAASILRIPLIIHDSDAHSGLTNRVLARWARFIAVGAPLEYYNYPSAKTRYAGVPVKADFRPYTDAEKLRAKELFHFTPDKPLLVVAGGGLGAKRINDAMLAIAPELIKQLSVAHLCGVRQYDDLKDKLPKSNNYKLIAFLSDHLARLLGAADIVVTRVGASAMAELAAAGASVIMVPNAQLTGGHQLKNAKIFAEAGAALSLDETALSDQPKLLLEQILRLLNDPPWRQQLSHNLAGFAKPEAAKITADLIEEAMLK